MTVVKLPYITDREIEKKYWNRNHEASSKSIDENHYTYQKARCGTNNILDIALLVAEIFITTAALWVSMLKIEILKNINPLHDSTNQTLVIHDDYKNCPINVLNVVSSNNNSAITKYMNSSTPNMREIYLTADNIDTCMLEHKYPVQDTLIEIITWIGVLVFLSALLLFSKDISNLSWAYFKLSRINTKNKKKKKREKKKKVNPSKIVPKIKKERSITSVLIDQRNEASAVAKLELGDKKRRASLRLERRKTLRENGNNLNELDDKKPVKGIGNNSVTRNASITSKLHIKHRAHEELLTTKIDTLRRASKHRLHKRITNKKNTNNIGKSKNDTTTDHKK